MKAALTERVMARMGKYETIEVTAHVEIDTEIDKVDPTLVNGLLEERVQDLLAPGIERASAYTVDEDSFIHTYAQDNEKRNEA